MKKKILYVNNYGANYSTFERIKIGEYSRSHMWGIYELFNSHSDEIELITSPNLQKINFRLLRLLRTFSFQIKLFFKYRSTPVIYAGAAHLIDIFALMKKMKIYHGKLFVVIHHPTKSPYLAMYDRIITISEYTHKYLEQKGCKNTKLLFWGPDLNFYNTNSFEVVNEKTIDFYSNGKSFRDFDILRNLDLPYDITILANKDFVPSNLNIKILEHVDAIKNVQLCKQSKIMLIPISKNVRGICGLTSVIDGLGGGMPLLISDNSNIGLDIEKQDIGFVYKAGDKEDLKRKMKEILIPENYNRMKSNVKSFAENNDYNKFAMEIKILLENEVN